MMVPHFALQPQLGPQGNAFSPALQPLLTSGTQVLDPHWTEPPFLLDLLQDLLSRCSLLLWYRAKPSLRDLPT